jgi:TetR/AcrR family transcriptional regulator, ethionamide resistance regulator
VSSSSTLAAVAVTPRRQAVEDAVLRAAEELLEEGASFAELNVERIATRAGIGRTAFYFYFRDKRELLMRLTSDVSEQLYSVASRWFAGDDDELVSALREIGELYREHAALLRVIVEVSTYDDEVAEFWRGLVGRFVEATRARIEAEDADLPAEATAFALVWMTERAFHQLTVQNEPIAREELVEALAGIWRRTVYGA